ncbi:hypothetical protein ABEB36_012498 [Hypothenemus hampei]|uniref:Uncharacterized protein n=1 Tax=Hypothenemus hampei TaxID=57062 RepID=A0ABD1EBG8_HYPHA
MKTQMYQINNILFNAVGVVQLILNRWDDYDSEISLKLILVEYQEHHTEAKWKLASNYSYLVLPKMLGTLKYPEDILTGTEITLFATPVYPVTTTTMYPTTPTSTSTTSSTITGSRPSFSVSLVTFENVDDQFLYETIGLKQFYSDKEEGFNKALPELLESLQKYENRDIWKVAVSCSYVQNYTDYVWLYESYTHTDVIVFV